MGKQRNCKGSAKNYDAEIKLPVRKVCAHCGKKMIRDYFDIVKYQLNGLEFCSQQCYANYVNKEKLESVKSISINQRRSKNVSRKIRT